MTVSISFNGGKITDKLDLLTQTQLPWIATKTLQGLAQEVKKELKKEMKSKFVNYSSFTENSIGIEPSTKKKLETSIFHKDWFSKGNNPSDYLKPTITGGDIYLTRFQRRLQRKGILGGMQAEYMMPIHNDKPGYGKVSRATYVKALWGIRAMEDIRLAGPASTKKTYKTQGSYVWVPQDVQKYSPEHAGRIRGYNNKPYKKGEPRLLPGPGIYKVQKSGLKQVFSAMNTIPDPEPKYKFNETSERTLFNNWKKIFRQQVKLYAK